MSEQVFVLGIIIILFAKNKWKGGGDVWWKLIPYRY